MMKNNKIKVLSDEELDMITGGTTSSGETDWSKIPCPQRMTEEECLKPGQSCKWTNMTCIKSATLKPIHIER